MTKKFYSIFFKKSRGPRFASEPDSFPLENCAGTVCKQTVWFPKGTMSPWSLHRNGAKSLIPKTSSARGSKMPAGILRRGRIARASPMKKVRSMRAFFINERAVNYGLRSHWNYVGRHGANKFLLCYPRGLSGGQFTAEKFSSYNQRSNVCEESQAFFFCKFLANHLTDREKRLILILAKLISNAK